MALSVKQVDVWQGHVGDQPGQLAEGLATLSAAGADFEFILARRDDQSPGKSIVFVAPVKGARQTRAAAKAGLRKSKQVFAVRVEGDDQRGLAAGITRAIGAAGVNIRGFAGRVLGDGVGIYVSVESKKDAATAVKAIKALR